MLKDVAGTGGLKVLSMYVRTFGYGMSTVVGTKGLTDMFATMWGSENAEFSLDFQTSFCSVILSHHSINGQKVSNPNAQKEQSFEVLPDGHIKAMEESKTIRNRLQGQVRTMLAAMQEQHTHTHTADHLQTTHG